MAPPEHTFAAKRYKQTHGLEWLLHCVFSRAGLE